MDSSYHNRVIETLNKQLGNEVPPKKYLYVLCSVAICRKFTMVDVTHTSRLTHGYLGNFTIARVPVTYPGEYR